MLSTRILKIISMFRFAVSQVINRNTRFAALPQFEVALYLYLLFQSPQNGGENCEGESRGLPRICNRDVNIS